MSAIDQVIARARQADVGFTERRQFKLARRRAIDKLRRFALADPYFYILELIQAAVAGGGDYVDIACRDGDLLISWTGGMLREDELAQLFDFLFASKDRLDLVHVRSLALGVNALLLFEPDEVVIESGDGSPGGTTRMVVRAGADEVDVGRAEGRLAGTYVRATKLKRHKVASRRRGADDGNIELGTIESRCLSAPVPVVFNGQPVFGWARQRLPNLPGYASVQSFDEGDLYGIIGIKPVGSEPSFRLLTHGVWIQTYQYDLLKPHKFGGIVCFDRLHKTIDHSGFVRDDRFAELWLRLRPYAEALAGGRGIMPFKFTSVEGLEYSIVQLRELLRAHPRVVIIPPIAATPDDEHDSDVAWRGESIARLLDAQILRVDESQIRGVRVLGEANLLMWRPQLDDASDLRFYNEAEIDPPQGPYLLPPIELEGVKLDELITSLANERAPIMLGETGTIRAVIYSPDTHEQSSHGLLVRITTTGRLLGEHVFASAYPGRVIDVELPTAQPAAMRATGASARVAEYFAEQALPRLREQDERAFAGLGVGAVEPDSAAARLALRVLSRVSVTRLRPAEGSSRAGLSFSLLRPAAAGFDPLGSSLVRTLAGEPLSLRELARRSEATGGLIYGTIPGVPADLEGLDRGRILALDPSSERALIGLLGEAAYVRVDGRDQLASAGEFVIRDIALGLREYPDFPLLIELREGGAPGAKLDQLDERGQTELLGLLVRGLIRRVCGEADEPGADPRELEEHRRQAVRHLQWCVCHEYARSGAAGLEAHGLLDFPLFVDLDGGVWAMREVGSALRSPEGLVVHYGHSLGGTELGSLSAAARAGRPASQGRLKSLGLSVFGHGLLAPLGRIRLAFDFDLDDIEAGANPATASTAFLVETRVSSDWGEGVLGIPATRLADHRILLRTHERGAVASLNARVYGVVGSIELRGEVTEAVVTGVAQMATGLLERLIITLPEFIDDERRREAAIGVLLAYAGELLSCIADAGGLTAQVSTPLATRILGLPLFDVGAATLVSAQWMIARFRERFESGYFAGAGAQASLETIDWSQIVVESTPAVVLDWLNAKLQPAAVIMPASSAAASLEAAPNVAAPGEPATGPVHQNTLRDSLEYWLARLRPDAAQRSRGARPTSVWIIDQDIADGGLIEGSDARVTLWAQHALVSRVLGEPTPSNLAWLLLAVYAHINGRAHAVTDAHERDFHLIVGEALADGRLQVLTAIEIFRLQFR